MIKRDREVQVGKSNQRTNHRTNHSLPRIIELIKCSERKGPAKADLSCFSLGMTSPYD